MVEHEGDRTATHHLDSARRARSGIRLQTSTALDLVQEGIASARIQLSAEIPRLPGRARRPGLARDCRQAVDVETLESGKHLGRVDGDPLRPARDFSPRLLTETVDVAQTRATIELAATDAGLHITIWIALDAHGVLHQRAELTNTGSTPYRLDALRHTLPIPPEASELLTTTGRHLRARHPQREPVTVGRHARQSRRGRPGADATVITAVGTPRFGFESGTLWCAHLAWSGNHEIAVERQPSGITALQASELLLPGEVILQPGESYRAPELLATCGDGLNEVSARFHASLRARPEHPSSPRPVTLNTWEAVYFDQSLEKLTRLAEAAAEVGVERLVLDDGSEAWYVYTLTGSSAAYPPGAIRFPGLHDDVLYIVTRVAQPGGLPDFGLSELAWAESGVCLPGRVLRMIGVQAPVLGLEQATVIHLSSR